MIKYFYILFIFIIIGLYINTNSYANELVIFDNSKTIKELKQNIVKLNKIDTELKQELINLNADGRLQNLIKKDINKIELKNIKKIIKIYNTNIFKIKNKKKFKSKNVKKIISQKKELIKEKKNLYIGLYDYINNKLKKEYLEYIKGDILIFNKKTNNNVDIVNKQNIIERKVEKIEAKIKNIKSK